MKYGELTLGQVEAIVNKLGGMESVKRFLAGEAVVSAKAIAFQHDMTKEGWKLLEDVPFDGQPFIPDIVGFLKSGESYVNGNVMRQRAKQANACLGQRHAEYLLNNQHLIPAEFRQYCLVFPGTFWQHRDGSRSVPYLTWIGGRWYLDFRWLGYDWRSDARLVSVRK